MHAKKLYLRQNIVLEPLINQWYAWGNLVAPQTYAMMMTNWHFKIMESYVKSPMMHAKALKNPKMLGGPFIDLPGNQTGKVKELLETSRRDNADLVALADAIRKLETLLSHEAKGNSLLNLYPNIPATLQGLVELGYDLNNQPSLRFIEGLVYATSLYDERRQSVLLQRVEADDRPFALSTPRFANPKALHLSLPFSSSALDRLFSMRDTPRHLDDVADLIPEDDDRRQVFLNFFTEKAPNRRGHDRTQLGSEVRIKYFGHATLLLETRDVSILTDPIISYDIEHQTVPRFSYEDLPESIDYVVITHNHQDHIMWETLLQLRHKIKHIVVPRNNGGTLQDPSAKLMLQHTGFKNIIELDEMEPLAVPGGTITGLPFFGEHGELHIHTKLAYHFRLNNRAVVCTADSNNLSPRMYDLIREVLGPVDMVFLGMECEGAPMSWLYGPLMTKPIGRKQDQERRLDGSDCRRGLAMIDSLGPDHVFVYAMGQEPWLTFASSIAYTEQSKPIVESNALVSACHERGLQSERLFGRKSIRL